jgi:fucose permease
MLNWLPRHLIAQEIGESRALNILSLGFGLGILAGRLGASQVLRDVSAVNVTLVASIGMAVTTFLTLRTRRPFTSGAMVFFAGIFMAPVLPTTLAIVGDVFPRMSSTAIGIVITCGWIGLAVSSRLIGAIAGNDPERLKRALLVIPAFSVLMIGVNLAIGTAVR